MSLTLVSLAIFRDSIQFEDRYFNVRSIYTSNGSLNTKKSNVAFSGPPRPELEEAWTEILACQFIFRHLMRHFTYRCTQTKIFGCRSMSSASSKVKRVSSS